MLIPKSTIIGVIHNQCIEVVNTRNIIRCKTSGKSTVFYLDCGKQIKTSKNLLCYVGFLEQFGFGRFDRSELINLSFIKKITKTQLHLVDGSIINLPLKRSKVFKDFVQELLNLDGKKLKNEGRFPSVRLKSK